jgi:hypothetical protein
MRVPFEKLMEFVECLSEQDRERSMGDLASAADTTADRLADAVTAVRVLHGERTYIEISTANLHTRVHHRPHMLVDLGHLRRRPPHQILHHPRVHAAFQQHRGVPVAQVMHPVVGQLQRGQQVVPVLPVRPVRAAGEHQAADIHDRLVPVRLQRGDRPGGQRDGPPRLRRLRRLDDTLPVDAGERLADGDRRRRGQPDVPPAQPERLTLPQPGADRQYPPRTVRPLAAGVEDGGHLGRARRLGCLPVGLRRRHERARVVRQPPPGHRHVQAGAEDPVRRLDRGRRQRAAEPRRPGQQLLVPRLDVFLGQLGELDPAEVRHDVVEHLLAVRAVKRVRVHAGPGDVPQPVLRPLRYRGLAPFRQGEAVAGGGGARRRARNRARRRIAISGAGPVNSRRSRLPLR